jgi:hypothetical protein
MAHAAITEARHDFGFHLFIGRFLFFTALRRMQKRQAGGLVQSLSAPICAANSK